ncbi:MAG: isoprenylcysteine carboxylmethyltransferase family protein [Candidatus Lindowbacteria bacterium]|nr:isoprenylcysteine carboxylmethyltransferase family protein [Candidatus Lindowbacteria bacterium]
MDTQKMELKPENFVNRSLAIRLGRVFFRARNFTGLPLFLFMLSFFAWEYENDLVTWPVGCALIGAGQALRLWAMRHIGRSARTRKDKARRLVASGPYRYTRNPLYIGNHLMLAGYCVLSELLWLLPFALVICFIFYSFIAAYEEELLKERFGEDYVRYSMETPRWLPIWPRARTHTPPPEGSSWVEALRRERSTIYGVMIATFLFFLKEVLSDWS